MTNINQLSKELNSSNSDTKSFIEGVNNILVNKFLPKVMTSDLTFEQAVKLSVEEYERILNEIKNQVYKWHPRQFKDFSDIILDEVYEKFTVDVC